MMMHAYVIAAFIPCIHSLLLLSKHDHRTVILVMVTLAQ
jgi:hypothetical protein